MAVRQLRQRRLALHDPRVPVAVLLVEKVVQAPRLAHVLRDVRRERRRHLPDLQQPEGELRLPDGLDDPLRLRHELRLAQPPGRLGRGDEPLRVLRAHVAVDALLDRLCAELRDRVTRVDSLRAALVAEVAPCALPDPVLAVEILEPRVLGAVARIAHEAHRLRERLGPEELRARLHRVALRDAAAAVDAERLLADHVHPFLRDPVLPSACGTLYPGCRYGLTARNLAQNGSMSTTRSLTIGRFPIAEITGT